MYFTVVGLLALAASTFATPLSSRQDSLQPWLLSGISSFSPSGRPGSYPWITLTASLTDPNALVLGTGEDGTPVTLEANNTASNCQAKWLSGTKPFGRQWPCDNSGNGYWIFEVIETANFTLYDFEVKFTRVAETIYHGSSFGKRYEGTAHFAVPDQLGGSCGGSGVCSWGLKQELSPYAVQQHEVAVQ